eukprot:6762120-Prymnesium_polylepis.1
MASFCRCRPRARRFLITLAWQTGALRTQLSGAASTTHRMGTLIPSRLNPADMLTRMHTPAA